MITDPLLWLCAALGAFMVGVSKAGITGLSILSIALFNHVFPSSKQASGLVLPLLIFGDFVAVFAYRKHTQWHYLWRLFPWTAAGVVLGYLTLGRISDHTARILIGWIIVALAALSFWRKYVVAPNEEKAAAFHWSAGAVIGMTAGFITLVANAAGPLMAIYLVAMRLPKMEYVGTAAVFFMLLNLFKVPFMVDLGLITTQSFSFNLMLAPAVLLGTLAGRWLLQHVNQNLFEQLVLLLSAIGGILLI
ncbi:MAG TPA: sulfite exporter TauE/SafE family protein, partial [Steroidobacteraceae bacterium]|nr:sulfite exporter TauE/SafE family protein [Steroidobacteraceae bacterium]